MGIVQINKKVKYLLLLLLLVSCKDTTTTIVRVIDGDSMVTADDKRLRLWQVDAPELHGQAFGREAKNYVQSIILNKDVKIEFKGKDKYGRDLAVLYVGNQNLAYLLAAKGYVHVNTRYCKDQKLISLYNQSKFNHAGLFANPNYITPSKWRKLH